VPPSFRELALRMPLSSEAERRAEPRARAGMIPARLTDLYRERVPVWILNASRSGLGLKVEEPFTVNLPVLIECEGLIVVGNVRHCLRIHNGGYLLGMKIQKVVDTLAAEQESESAQRATSP
jgi:hypothetical protein